MNIRLKFNARWKEELVCSCDQGRFVLELSMGVFSLAFPTEAEWLKRAPEWARPHWTAIRAQVEAWCRKEGIPLYIEERAPVYKDSEP